MVGDIVNDFSTTGISTALAANGLGHKDMFSDIGIMQKLTTRVEDNETWYYTGAYSGHLNCVIKSRILLLGSMFLNLTLLIYLNGRMLLMFWETCVFTSGGNLTAIKVFSLI